MCRLWSLALLLALVGLVPMAQVSAAKPHPYVLREQPFYKGQDIDHTVLRLYRRHGKKPVWTCTVTDIEDLTWSRNGRAFVFWFMHPTHENRDAFDMFIWREGGRPRLFHSDKFDHADYLWDFQWSPNGREVAFLMGGSGNMDAHDGDMLIYDYAHNRLIRSPKESVARMRWISAYTLRYLPRFFHEDNWKTTGWYYNGKARLWRIRSRS